MFWFVFALVDLVVCRKAGEDDGRVPLQGLSVSALLLLRILNVFFADWHFEFGDFSGACVPGIKFDLLKWNENFVGGHSHPGSSVFSWFGFNFSSLVRILFWFKKLGDALLCVDLSTFFFAGKWGWEHTSHSKTFYRSRGAWEQIFNALHNGQGSVRFYSSGPAHSFLRLLSSNHISWNA